jgi:hypothetical protein
MPSSVLTKNQYHFVEAIFQTIPTGYREVAAVMKVTLDHLANAAGLASSPHFDETGNYTLTIPNES